MLLTINDNGTLDVSGITDYETLVTTDDIIPNKKYVDDTVASGGSATALGYLWTSTISITPSGSGDRTLVIGDGAKANDAVDAVVIGHDAEATTGSSNAVVIGEMAIGSSTNAIAIARLAQADHLAVAIGNAAISLGDAAVSIAVSAEASGENAIAIGREAISDRFGEMQLNAQNSFSTRGDLRASRFIMFNETTDDTPTELYVNHEATDKIPLASDSTMTFKGLLSARRTDADDESAGFEISGVIDNNAGMVALVGTPSVTTLGDDSAGAWVVAVSADVLNASLAITVTGEVGKTIRWACFLDVCDIRG